MGCSFNDGFNVLRELSSASVSSGLFQRIEGSPRLVRIFLLLWLRLEIPPSGAACFRVSVALLERVPEAHARSSGSFDPPGLALRLSGRAPSSAPGLSAPCRFGKTCLSRLHPRNSEVFPPAWGARAAPRKARAPQPASPSPLSGPFSASSRFLTCGLRPRALCATSALCQPANSSRMASPIREVPSLFHGLDTRQ